MGKSFFAVLSRNTGTLLLSLAIVLSVSYYLLGYVPQRTASLNHRYFRVLARLGQNIQAKTAAQHFNDEGDARSLAHLLSYRLGRFYAAQYAGRRPPPGYTPVQGVREAGRLLSARPGPERYGLGALTRPARAALGQDTITDGDWLRLEGNHLLFSYELPPLPGTATRYELTHSIPVDTLLRELLRPDVFDYFLVVELPSQRLLYSSGPTDVYLSAAEAGPGKFHRLTRWLADSSLVHTGRAGALAFGGQDYQVFAQPARLGAHLSCLLVGGVPSSRFNTEARALPAGWPELLLGLLLLGALALPFLKLWLMSSREQINRGDVLLCAASLILGSGVLLLTVQAALANYDSESRIITTQLRGLSRDVATDLHRELAQLNDVVRQVDDSVRRADEALRRRPRPDSLRPDASGAVVTWHRPFPCRAYYRRGSAAGHYGDYLTWMSADGQARFRLDPTIPDRADPAPTLDALARALQDSSYCLPSLAGRQYLKKVNARAYQRIADELYKPDSTESVVYTFRRAGKRQHLLRESFEFRSNECFFDMIRTLPSASSLWEPPQERDIPRLQALLARPSRWGRTPLVCAFETRLLCFDNRIIPPGYGFCLIERTGNVMAHSNPDLNLSENLLTDCEPSGELRAALYARQPTSLQVVYQGKPTALYVRPLPGMGRYLIAFFDLRYAKAQQTQTSLLAVLLLGGFWLLGGLLGLLRWQLLPRIPHYHFSRNRFQYLWPRPAYAAHYWLVATGLALGLLAAGAVATQVGPLSQLTLLLLLPLPLYVFTYHYLRSPSEDGWRVERALTWLAGATLLAGLAAHWRWVGGHETAWLAGFVLGLVGLGGTLMRRRLASWLTQHNRPRHYRAAYAAVLLGWVGVLAIVPALNCYRIAQLAENLQQVRYGQLQLLAAYSAYKEHHQLVAYGTNTTNFHYYCDFFFGSDLKVAGIDPIQSPGPVAPADALALRLFANLQLPLGRPGEEAGAALELDSTANQQWHPWQVSSLAGRVLQVTSYDNASRSWVPSRLGGLRPGALAEWPAAGWWLVGAVGLLLLVLWVLIQYLLRRLFGLAAAITANPPLPAAPATAAPARRFWVLPAGSAWVDMPPWVRQALEPAVVIDCRQVFGPGGAVGAALVGPVAAAPGAVVLASFDYRLTDPALTRRKCELLTELQRRNWPLVVLSASHPAAFGDCGHPLERACPEAGHQAIREAGELLLSTLAEFQAEYFALSSAAPPPVPADAAPRLLGTTTSLARFFEQECQAMPFVARVRPTLLALLWQRQQLGQQPDRATIKAAVLQLAQFNFRRLWLTLSPHEKFILLDLAQDGLANTDAENLPVLRVLLQKGLLRLTSSSRLSLSSASFQEFVLTEPRQREALRYVADTEQGTWAAARLPVLLVLGASALFLFTTQRSVFTQAQNFLLGLTTLVPALLTLVRQLLTSKPAGPAAGGA